MRTMAEEPRQEVLPGGKGVNVSIGDWEDDGTDYGGVAE